MKSLYQQVADYLLAQIEQGRFSYDKPLCTEKQLMEQFRVSNITAKRAITELESQGILYRKRGVGSFVSRVSAHRRQDGTDGARICAVVFPFGVTMGSDYMSMIQLINMRLNPHNCYISLYTTDRDKRREKNVLLQLLEQRVAGLIYYPNTNEIHLDLLEQFVLRDTSVLVLDKTVTAPFLHNVVCDNFDGARRLTEHLIEKGHTRIAYLSSSGIVKLSSVSERLGGYLYAMKTASLPVNEKFVITKLHDSIEEDRGLPSGEQLERICRLLALFRSSGVTAVECEHDGLAETVAGCCQEMSIRVPEDLSICGFDGRSPRRVGQEAPRFTTVYQNLEEMAEQAAEILLRAMDSCLPLGEKIRVPVELQFGKSTDRVAGCAQEESAPSEPIQPLLGGGV